MLGSGHNAHVLQPRLLARAGQQRLYETRLFLKFLLDLSFSDSGLLARGQTQVGLLYVGATVAPLMSCVFIG
jgi:hypothetical protein